MEQLKSLALIAFLTLSSQVLFAQTTASLSTTTNFATTTSTSSLAENYTDSWTFYTNDAEQMFLIDVKKLGGLAKLVVKDTEGTAVYTDDLSFLPADAVYEIDLNEFSTGNYSVELETYKGKVETNFIVE